MIRDLMYLYYDKDKSSIRTYGIEFKEFILSLDARPDNILVLSGDYWGTDFDHNTRCNYSSFEDINNFIEENVYHYGDFVWIDFEELSNLDDLMPEEIAELYYVGMKKDTITGSYFEKLGNKFIYTGHDDGWYNNIYYNNIDDFNSVLTNIIKSKIDRLFDIKICNLNKELVEKIRDLSILGIALDIMRFNAEEDGTFIIPMYSIGNTYDMDEVYERCRDKDIEVDYELRFHDEWILVKLNET